ncbi:hypothetical protein [Brevibacillus laterosporus]|uniref:Uncharacterized protein n=1 Tax=Brevibacillus laterosporus TaxID=1465 RepID=A0AAP3GBD7_BRELA|nr:hypothetical protein [Brevibacillus laterosporus]MCR8979695.1 hypothetical protein [Brevibacillus laterosporus]MCZ0806850.1 hypothetical protein [Brevibacillus laterosporus]MCZ0825626.1 hypothetical protein [Brevibacillus laterosporus]MCZ0849404.1 hypothetical protein [Brevibacillus laterosporus]
MPYKASWGLIFTATAILFSTSSADARQKMLPTSTIYSVTAPVPLHNKIMHRNHFIDNPALQSLLHLSREQLRTELDKGKSLADIANSRGVEKTKVIELIKRQHIAKLDEAVKNGSMTKERAEKVKEHATKRATHLVEGTLRDHERKHTRRGKLAPWENQELLTLLKMDREQLRMTWTSGKSLNEIAQSQGVSKQAVATLLQKAYMERIEKAVEDGHLSQEKANEIKIKVSGKIEKMLNKKWEDKNGHKHEGTK